MKVRHIHMMGAAYLFCGVIAFGHSMQNHCPSTTPVYDFEKKTYTAERRCQDEVEMRISASLMSGMFWPLYLSNEVWSTK